MVYDCCICFDEYDEELDNGEATTCGTCKNKICLKCYDKTTDMLFIDNDKLDKLVNKCCVCNSDTETQLSDFNKKQLEQLLKIALERINATDKKMLDYIKKYDELEDVNYKNEIDLKWIVGTAKGIVNSKKYKKREIKERLKTLVNNVGVF